MCTEKDKVRDLSPVRCDLAMLWQSQLIVPYSFEWRPGTLEASMVYNETLS